MKSARSFSRLLIVIALMAVVRATYPCSQARIGYFHQVTRLRGAVVGVNRGDLRHPFRWARQRVIRPDVKLTLYEYRWPFKSLNELPVVKVVKADRSGGFDFGTLPRGHYTVDINDPWGGVSSFDIEIVSQLKPVNFEIIDISPIYPDCKGGQEFVPIAG